jgi:hypothetical protein
MLLQMLRLIPEQRDMDAWTSQWVLRDNPDLSIVCRSCGACQFIEDNAKLFPHSRRCGGTSAYSQLPWRDLEWIIDHMKRAR